MVTETEKQTSEVDDNDGMNLRRRPLKGSDKHNEGKSGKNMSKKEDSDADSETLEEEEEKEVPKKRSGKAKPKPGKSKKKLGRDLPVARKGLQSENERVIPKTSRDFETKSPKRENSYISSLVVIILGILIGIVLSYLGYLPPLNFLHNAVSLRTNPTQQLYQLVKELQTKYPGQPQSTWNTLKAAPLLHLLPDSSPPNPVVLMLYRERHDNSEEDSFAEEVARIYTTVLSSSLNLTVETDSPLVIPGKKYARVDADECMADIDSKFQQSFNAGVRAAIVHDFDKLPPCSALVFHNYCNNDDAPYTHVAIILTVSGNSSNPISEDVHPKDLEAAVGKILQNHWSACPQDLHEAKIDAMLSRVANNVLLIRDLPSPSP